MDQTKFKNTQGMFFLNALFIEKAQTEETALYSLKDADVWRGTSCYPSIRRLYQEMNDPTEYSFATKYFQSFEHWNLLCQCPWFKPILQEMRLSLQASLKSLAWGKIIQIAKSSDKDSFTANRYLLEALQKAKGSVKSKKAIQVAEAQKNASQVNLEEIQADVRRLLS